MKIGVFSKKRIGIFVVVIALMVSTIFVPAQAWTLTGWKLERKLVFSPYSKIGSTSVSHFNEAFWQWNKECSVYNLQRTLTTHNLTNFYQEKEHGNKIFRVANHSDPAPASVRSWKNSSNKVVSADFNINVAFAFSNGGNPSSYDVWTVFMHETGHVLGFDHSSLDSVMNVYPMGTIKRYLTSNDIDGIHYLYN